MNTEEIMAKRRDRVISSILAFKERECDQHLPPETRSKLRKVILDQINDLYDFYSDILDSDGVVRNEFFLERLEAIYQAVCKDDDGS